ncbi:hypothetical protein GYMLUDRAFT_64827 [Collybiopsis luxurians FD-317 M1]|uniref:Uncharacterized protein n=1 Tax=Collybiopsis luxurians FD-317 M1 TaxID=944289 RepID=A0A0D0AMK2_9AGAR|nr:hypothetical protein GYMLUDRAFT_64827 [Collybiopsis luxurians FD-317 M1]
MIDNLYDKEASARSLAAIQAAREKERPMQTQVKDLCLTEGWQNFIEVYHFSEPTAWRMTWCQDGHKREEIQYHIQGIVEDKRLPPIKMPRGKKHIQHMKQSITISGLGSKQFDEDINAIIDIYAELARQVGQIEVFEIKDSEGRRMLEIGNRVFTPQWEAPNMEWIEPQREVDPERTIESMKTQHKNVVDFGEEKTEEEGEKRTYTMSPQKIHVGDIVDIAFSVVGIPTKQETKAMLILRAITLLDGMHTQNWIKAWVRGKPKGNEQVQLRKRSAFDDDAEGDVEEARKKLKELAVNEKAKMAED